MGINIDIDPTPRDRKKEQDDKRAKQKKRTDRQRTNYVPESVSDVSDLEYVAEENKGGSWYNR